MLAARSPLTPRCVNTPSAMTPGSKLAAAVKSTPTAKSELEVAQWTPGAGATPAAASTPAAPAARGNDEYSTPNEGVNNDDCAEGAQAEEWTVEEWAAASNAVRQP